MMDTRNTRHAGQVLGAWYAPVTQSRSFATTRPRFMPGAIGGVTFGNRLLAHTRATPVLAASVAPRSVTAAAAAKTEKPWAKTVIGGVVTIFFEMAGGGHALEFLKISKQVSNDSYMTIIRKMTATKGIAGALDGFFPWGFLQSAVKGAVFSWGQALSYGVLSKMGALDDKTATVLSGGCGGFVQGVVMSPALLLKTRVMTDPRFRTSGGVVETTVASAKLGGEIIAKEGVLVLCKGMGVFSFKRFCDWTTRYLFVEVVQTVYKGSQHDYKLSGVEKALCALAGGTLSALVTVPIDVMVATIQDAGKQGKKVSVAQTLKTQFASGGVMETIRFSTRGLGARVAHVALTTLMMKTVTSAVYDKVFRD